jgi:acyl-CoA reductase-like NAD-dependent aldehyde dehydrogenase
MIDENTLNLILREPIGVVGQIVPWNFPLLMSAWKLAPLIAAGDVSVFKPSSSTSLSMLELMKLIETIIPKGVINVITGKGSKSGEYLQHHKGLDKLAFTGSTEVGREIGLSAAQNIIPATLELGGKSANVFFKDADLDMALEGIQLGILFNQGQVCSAGSRIFVEQSFYDEFLEKAVKAFEKVKVGNPLDRNTQMGAQISEDQLKKILNYIEIGKKEGAKVATGGERYTDGDTAKGFFMKPTLLVDVTNEMRVAREEIFGPVGVVIKFKNEEDLIAMANDSEYGLAGGVFTRDLNKAIRVARGIRTGRVWVNTYNSFPAGAPFGGYKESGIGRETHKIILEHYSQIKNIIINLSENPGGMYVK